MIATGWIAWTEIAAALVAAAALTAIFLRRRRRILARNARLARPFTAAEEEVLDRDFPRWRCIPAALRERFAGITRVLMEEKNFEPCGGLDAVTDEMKLVIAAQAAFIILGKDDHGFFPRLHSILVYPTGFRDHGRRRFGIDDERRGVLYGESWETGSVILSWDNVVAGGRNEDDGMNVVFHEFAHQIDQYNGVADGVPYLKTRTEYARWATVMGSHFDALVEASKTRDPEPFLDPYGATHPCEFFAVATETFFEDPYGLEEEQPDLYDELVRFYGVNPGDWMEAGPSGGS
jgi:Mlc titration factor MtfA (ptsG expression regulator)